MPPLTDPPRRSKVGLARWLAQLPRETRAWIVGAVGLGGALFLARWLNARVPLQTWLSFQLAAIWVWQVYLAIACASAGYRLLSLISSTDGWTTLEKLAVGYPVGVVIFVLGIYAGGFLHLLRPAFAVVLPGILLAFGAPPIVRAWRGAHAAEGPPIRITLSGLPLAATVVGLLLLAVIYLGAMSPDAISYDASWNHLVIAQDYAREGRIVPFPGDWNKDLPHLGSVLNTWSFLVPGFGQPALRWMMALHTEFCVFVFTLVGVAATARWLADRQQTAMWTAFVLFPGIFVHDSNIGGAADHFLALFAAPLLLLTGKALARFDRGTCLLWGVLAGGALMTKAQGVYLVAPLAALLTLRAIHLTVHRGSGGLSVMPPSTVIKTGGLVAVAVIAVLLPHFVSNIVFFRNPIYPLLQDVFTASTPTIKDAPQIVRYMLADWRYLAPEPLVDKVTAAAKLAFTFSFVPHYSYVNQLPVFGSLFTLSLALLPMLKDARRLWLGALMAIGMVLTWALTYWVDRNLQGIAPALIAMTAAVLLRAWELGLYARIGVAALVIVQIAWSGNLYFQGADRVSGAEHLLRSTMFGRASESLDRYRKEYVALGNALPRNAVLMLHDSHSMLGIDRPVVLDWVGFQGMFDYRLYNTPRDLYDRLREVGVTHVAWVPSSPPARSKQEELIFDVFADAYGRGAQHFGPLTVFALPATAPAEIAPSGVLVVGIAGYADGLYSVGALSTCEELPPRMQHHAAPAKTSPPSQTAWKLLSEADAIFIASGAQVDAATNSQLNREFRQIRMYSAFRLLVRK